jgi:hypothetical protein|tara:strand:- start:5514 stop:5732 length:219 start_codon:yes stop_codon:yes gene_type:complete
MEGKVMRMTRQHYEFLADKLGPLVPWPTHLHSIADELEATNPKFDRDKFIRRGTEAWENNFNPPVFDDEIVF